MAGARRGMSREVTGGALGVALALFVAALPESPRGAPPCPAPSEREAREGRSVVVDCAAGTTGRPLRGPARLLFDLPLDPNVADALTLETLPGIGPVRAAAIVAERERRPFASAKEIVRVRGVGPHTAARLVPLLAVDRTR